MVTRFANKPNGDEKPDEESGASRETVNASTQVVAEVKIDVVRASGSARGSVSQQSNTYTVDEECVDQETISLNTGPIERGVFTLWQRGDLMGIADEKANPIAHQGTWRS